MLASAPGAALRLIGLGLAILFHWAWFTQPLGWPLASFHAALVLLALIRPREALLVLGGLSPLSTSLSILLQSPRAGWCLLAAMMWAVATGLLARRFPAEPGLRLKSPAILLATVALGSAVVAVAGHPLFVTGYSGVLDTAAGLISGGLFEWTWPWIPLHLAVIMSLALFIAVHIEQAARTDRQLAVRLGRMLLVGHAAAVALGLSRFASASLREEEIVSAWLRIMSDVRHYSQYDVNAAGSTLVIVACAGVGLLTVARSRAVTSIALLLVLTGVWMTGSRAALVSLLAVLLLKPLLDAVVAGGRHARLTGAATVITIAAVAAGLYAFYPAGRNVATSVAYDSRVIMLRTAWRAGLSEPVFGVGIGKLPERGLEFGSGDMEPLLGVPGTRENAHNQYLQVFAELGLLGIVAFALVIGSVGWMAAVRASADPLLSWTAWGLLASLLTWVLGHPLLVPGAAVAFWLFVGLTAGMSPAPAVQAGSRRLTRGLAGLLIAFAVLTIPFRISTATRLAHLEHQGTGVSDAWRHDGDVAYRTAGSTFSLFLPSSTAVVVPLRAARPSLEPVFVEVTLRGVVIDRSEISSDAWRRITVRLPDSDRSFERVEFAVRGAAFDPDDQDIVHVGKATDVRAALPDAR